MASAAGIIKIPAPEQVECKAGSGTTTAPAQQCEGESVSNHDSLFHNFQLAHTTLLELKRMLWVKQIKEKLAHILMPLTNSGCFECNVISILYFYYFCHQNIRVYMHVKKND